MNKSNELTPAETEDMGLLNTVSVIAIIALSLLSSGSALLQFFAK